MYVEQDYILRLIQEAIRVLLKLLFNIDYKHDDVHPFDNTDEQAEYERLLALIDQGKINEAENQLFAILDDSSEDNFRLALLFYHYLNGFDDKYLEQYGFCREEIVLGIKGAAKKCGYSEFVNDILSQLTF